MFCGLGVFFLLVVFKIIPRYVICMSRNFYCPLFCQFAKQRPLPVILFFNRCWVSILYALYLLFYLCCCYYCCFFLFFFFLLFLQDMVFLCSCHWLVTQYEHQTYPKFVELLPPASEVRGLKTCTNSAWLFLRGLFLFIIYLFSETWFLCIILTFLNLKFDQAGFEPQQSTCLCVLTDGIQGNYQDTCHQIQFLIIFKNYFKFYLHVCVRIDVTLLWWL